MGALPDAPGLLVAACIFGARNDRPAARRNAPVDGLALFLGLIVDVVRCETGSFGAGTISFGLLAHSRKRW